MTNLMTEETEYVQAKYKYLDKLNSVVRTLVDELQVEKSPERYDEDKTDTLS